MIDVPAAILHIALEVAAVRPDVQRHRCGACGCLLGLGERCPGCAWRRAQVSAGVGDSCDNETSPAEVFAHLNRALDQHTPLRGSASRG